MLPVKYITQGSTGYWQATTTSDPEWFDYSQRKWANVMLQDGLQIEENTGKIIKPGSMFVYIPRYAYRLPENSYHTSTVGEIKIKFLNTDNTCKDSSETIVKSAKDFPNGAGMNTVYYYIQAPAFTFDNKELEGIWVAKYETSHADAGTTSAAMGTGIIKVAPNVTSWRNVDIYTALNTSMQMKNNSIYGLGSDLETLMILNTQWDAVAYLSQSIYGKNSEVQVNTSANFITGFSGDLVSTTGNIYGIYDMSGGAYEYVSGYLNEVTGNTYVTNFNNIADKYKIKYKGNSTNSQDLYDLNKNSEMWNFSSNGTGATSWNLDYSTFLSNSSPFFWRGGGYSDGNSSGIFAFNMFAGIAHTSIGYRISIVN